MPNRALVATLAILTLTAGCLGNADTEQDATEADPDPLAGAVWTQHDAAPSARTEVVAAPIEPGGAEHLVIGGFFLEAHRSRIVEVYDASDGRWSQAPDYPIPIYHTAALNVDGDVLVFGGHTTPAFVPTDLVYRYDADTQAWEMETRMPVPRGAHDATVVDGEVVVVGGYDASRQPIAQVDVYDPGSGTWSQGPDLPMPRDHLAVVGVDGKAYAIGGREVDLDANTGRVDVLELGDDAWTQAASMPTPRGGIGAELFRGEIVVAGGERSNGTFATVEAYDPANDTWRRLPDLPTARHGIATAVWGDRLYTFMGGPEPSIAMSDAVESLGG